ncbi:hypothetical protein MRB53_039923 [Persea americana]|nr:hypothetical protein MRB53_039923 [Persea americana]
MAGFTSSCYHISRLQQTITHIATTTASDESRTWHAHAVDNSPQFSASTIESRSRSPKPSMQAIHVERKQCFAKNILPPSRHQTKSSDLNQNSSKQEM